MKSMWKMMCFVVVAGLCIGSSGYAGVLFSDTFECEAEFDVQDLQNEACDAGRSGTYAASGYLQSPDGWTYQHQVRTTNELLLYDGKATPNVDMSGSDSAGGFSVSVDINPASGLAPTAGDWLGIVVGGSGLNDVWADGFGVLFRKNGTIQAWDNGANIVSDNVTWNSTPDDVYHNLQIVAADATDGNPFDGVGTTTFEIFIDGSSVYSVDLDGANYPENYVTLQGQVNGFYDNLVISQVPEPTTLMLLGLGAVSMRMRRRR